MELVCKLVSLWASDVDKQRSVFTVLSVRVVIMHTAVWAYRPTVVMIEVHL